MLEEPEIEVHPISNSAPVNELDRASLEEALDRFWDVNIRPLFPNRDVSVLSEDLVKIVVARLPTTKEQWFRVVPIEKRGGINPGEVQFLEDVFEVVMEYE